MMERHIYKTDNYDSFLCVGSACPYTCCNANWIIVVDQQTDAFYRTVEGAFGERLNAQIDRTQQPPRMRASGGYCAMLTKEGLCGIQLKLGKEALCETCRTYPRTLRVVPGASFMTLSPACPEVARHMLTGDDPLMLLEATQNVHDSAAEPWRIEAFRCCYKLLRDENCSILQRQKLLLLFNSALTEALSANDAAKVDLLLSWFANEDNYRAMIPERKDAVSHLTSKLHLITELCELLMKESSCVEAQWLLVRILEHLRTMDVNGKEPEIMQDFFKQLYKGAHGCVQESMLLYELTQHYLGDDFSGDPYSQAAHVVVRAQLPRIFFAIGSTQKGELLTLEERVQYYSFLFRGFEHDVTVREKFAALLRETGMLEMDFLFRLIS